MTLSKEETTDYQRTVEAARKAKALRDATPELLAALEDMMRDVPQCAHEPVPIACRYCFSRVAIAKARGEK